MGTVADGNADVAMGATRTRACAACAEQSCRMMHALASLSKGMLIGSHGNPSAPCTLWRVAPEHSDPPMGWSPARGLAHAAQLYS